MKDGSKMQSGTGIQELMAAETRASQIVAEARIGEFIVAMKVKEREGDGNSTVKKADSVLKHVEFLRRDSPKWASPS